MKRTRNLLHNKYQKYDKFRNEALDYLVDTGILKKWKNAEVMGSRELKKVFRKAIKDYKDDNLDKFELLAIGHVLYQIANDQEEFPDENFLTTLCDYADLFVEKFGKKAKEKETSNHSDIEKFIKDSIEQIE